MLTITASCSPSRTHAHYHSHHAHRHSPYAHSITCFVLTIFHITHLHLARVLSSAPILQAVTKHTLRQCIKLVTSGFSADSRVPFSFFDLGMVCVTTTWSCIRLLGGLLQAGALPALITSPTCTPCSLLAIKCACLRYVPAPALHMWVSDGLEIRWGGRLQCAVM